MSFVKHHKTARYILQNQLIEWMITIFVKYFPAVAASGRKEDRSGVQRPILHQHLTLTVICSEIWSTYGYLFTSIYQRFHGNVRPDCHHNIHCIHNSLGVLFARKQQNIPSIGTIMAAWTCRYFRHRMSYFKIPLAYHSEGPHRIIFSYQEQCHP